MFVRSDNSSGFCVEHARSAYQKAYREANADRLAVQKKARRVADPSIVEAARARDLARRKNLFAGGVQRYALYLRDLGICHLCQCPTGEDWNVDHVIPLAKGGPDCMDNAAVAHRSCNSQKGQVVVSTPRLVFALAAFEMFHGRPFDD